MRLYKVQRDKRDLRDFTYRSMRYVTEKDLPRQVDLRKRLSPVVDQGRLGSCTSNAIVSGLREFWLLNGRGSYVRLSRLFHYWQERKLRGTIGSDSGASIRDGMKALHQTGVCPETMWPYRITAYKKKPGPRAHAAAKPFRIKSYSRIHDLAGMKAALAERRPVVFGIMLYQSFDGPRASATGKIPYPNKKKELFLGGHAMLAVGYRDAGPKGQGVIIARNSWGKRWGDRGYCYIPYRFFRDRTLTFDFWTGR